MLLTNQDLQCYYSYYFPHFCPLQGDTCIDPLQFPMTANMRSILGQVFTYMVVTGVLFSFITCYHSTLLCWRPLNECDSLYVSAPIDMSATMEGPSVTAMAALSWLQTQALEQTLQHGLRHRCLNIEEHLNRMVEVEEENDVDDPGPRPSKRLRANAEPEGQGAGKA